MVVVTCPSLAHECMKIVFTHHTYVCQAWGVICAMEGALHHRKPGDTLAGKIVAVQGLGNVATPMITRLFEKGVKV